MKFLVNLTIGSAAVLCALSSGDARAAGPAHVTCVGDSITQGDGTSNPPSTAYPAQLQALLGTGGYVVQNDGHSGATLLVTGDLPYTGTGEYTASGTFAAAGGDVVIQLGTNDSKAQNWDAHKGTFEQDCENLVAHYQGLAGKPRVWVNLPPPVFADAYGIRGAVVKGEVIPLLQQCAAARGAMTIDVFDAEAGQGGHFADGVHPDDTGAGIIAQTVKAAITKLPTLTLAATAATFTLPSPATFTSTATAAYGKVEAVELFEGATSVAKSTTAPFALSATLPAGAHTLHAVATETGGRTATSADVMVTVKDAPPGLDAGLPADAGASKDAGGSGGAPHDGGGVAPSDAGSGGSSASSSSSGSATNPDSPGTGSDAGASAGAGDDGGCSVTRESDPSTPLFGLGLALAACSMLRRKRRA